jgi:cytochrome c oxidase subunit 4
MYAGILAALLVLTAITVAAARVNFGSPMINVVVALTIATFKGSLVALYFMHLRYDKPLNAIIFVAGLATLALFLMACFGDTAARLQG